MKMFYKILYMLLIVFDIFLIIVTFIFIVSSPFILIYSFINLLEFLFLKNPKKLAFIFVMFGMMLLELILFFMTSKLEYYLKCKMEEGDQNVQ